MGARRDNLQFGKIGVWEGSGEEETVVNSAPHPPFPLLKFPPWPNWPLQLSHSLNKYF